MHVMPKGHILGIRGGGLTQHVRGVPFALVVSECEQQRD